MDNYRAVMEVLKWLEPPDLLKSTVKVNSRWLEVSNSREIWQSLLPADIDIGSLTPKEYYSKYLTKHIYVVLNSHIKEFNVTLKTWRDTQLSKRIKSDWTTTILPVNQNTVVVCGARSKKRNTLLVHPKTGNVTTLDTLTPYRVGIGAIVSKNILYAFCGAGSTQCSKLDLGQTRVGGKIPSANFERAHFNPCVYNKLVYLVGGTDSPDSTGERYNLTTREFTKMSLKLVIDQCVLYISPTGVLTVITESKYTTRTLTSKSPVTWLDLVPNMWICCSGSPPMVVDNEMFFLHRAGGQVVEMEMTGFTWQGHAYEKEILPRMKRK